MKKSLFLFCILAVLFVQVVSAQQLGELYRERNAGFTMSMPAGWQTFDFNQKYLMIMGPEDSGLSPNIGFADEAYNGSISGYVDIFLPLIQQFFSDFSMVDRSSFTTSAGVTGECVTYTATMGTIRVRQKVYVFPNRRGNAIMVITGTAPVNSGTRYDEIFDASVKTFVWTR